MNQWNASPPDRASCALPTTGSPMKPPLAEHNMPARPTRGARQPPSRSATIDDGKPRSTAGQAGGQADLPRRAGDLPDPEIVYRTQEVLARGAVGADGQAARGSRVDRFAEE